MCVRTQLAPSAQTLQVGETSTISRGSLERVLKSERSWPTLRRSVSCRVPDAEPFAVDPVADVGSGADGCCGSAFLWPLQPAAASANVAMSSARRFIRARVPLGESGGVAARGYRGGRARRS